MYSNNKGSVLIFTLIIFSIVSMVTMMCIGLNYSNETVFRLEYKKTTLIENSLSGIELASNNILNEIKINLDNTNSESEFGSYFLGNNFSNSVCDISNIDISNLKISISQDYPFYTDGVYNFKITSSSSSGNYSKKYQAKVKIKNPFLDYKEDILEVKPFKDEIKANELLEIYDYKEI